MTRQAGDYHGVRSLTKMAFPFHTDGSFESRRPATSHFMLCIRTGLGAG